MDILTIEDLWGKEAYADSGLHLGRIEAVGMGRRRVPRRIGVRAQDDGSTLRFFSVTEVTVSGDRVIVVTGPALQTVPADSDP